MYRIKICYVRWECGDGCCSDSGYTGELWHENRCLKDYDDWSYNRCHQSLIHDMIGHIEDRIGRKPILDEDYTLYKYCRDYNTGEEYDEGWGFWL